MKRAIGAAVLATSLLAGAASAHHAFSMFDTSKIVVLVGEVRDFQWTNPHTWIQLDVVDNGQAREWSIECLSVGALNRNGWRPKSFQPGDKVTIRVYPLKDGSTGGAFVGATLANGQTLGAMGS